MEQYRDFLTTDQLADILHIKARTVNLFVSAGKIPYNYVRDGTSDDPLLRFNPRLITGWLKQGPTLILDENDYIEKLRKMYQEQFPEALKALREIDRKIAVKEPPKGFSLSKVPSKKYGFLYYVRYLENGKLVPSRWCTGTNDREYAEKFARENRERLLTAYHYKKHHCLYAVLGNYYKEGSAYLEDDGRRGRMIGEKTRSVYHHFMTKVLIPFLRSEKVGELSGLTPPVITALQDSLLSKGNKPQTINRYLGSLRCVLDYLVMHGKAEENVFDKVTMLKTKKQHYRIRGCYEIGKLKGVFNRQWNDEFSCLLCLIIYTTGIRNSEMEKLRVKDMVTIGKYAFLNIRQSKTENGIRMVPLHGFVYRKLITFCAAKGKRTEDYIFTSKGNHLQSPVYRKANTDMGAILKYTETDLEKQGISFYSGRHYWKTLMNAEGLGEIEEYFMGHKVSRNVAKRYNHLDRQGKKKLVEKAKEVYAILDKYLL